jgi:hypothetical protein
MADDYKPDTPRNRGDYDAPHMSPVTPAEDARTIMINKVSWGAVLAGVVVALVFQLIFNMFGIGIGAATLDPGAGSGDNPTAAGFSIGAGLWWVASGVVASLIGGITAGRLSGQPKPSTAAWHGLTTWALTTLVIFYLLSSAVGGLLGGAYRGIANAAGGLTSTVGEVAQSAAPGLASSPDPFSAIERSVRDATGGNDPAALRDAAVAAVRAAVTGNQQQATEARDRAADAIARAQGVPVDQARSQVQQYEQQYRQAADQARAQATRAADVAASAVAQGALYAALGLLLGGLAAWFGGRMAAVEPTVTGPSYMAAPSIGHQEGTRTTLVAAEGARQSPADTIARR